jgi:hypothetical protein
VLSVITCSTPFFVNYTSISVNFEKIKVIIYEHTILTCNHIYLILFANKSNILSYLEILPPCALSSNLGEEMAYKEDLGVGVLAGC